MLGLIPLTSRRGHNHRPRHGVGVQSPPPSVAHHGQSWYEQGFVSVHFAQVVSAQWEQLTYSANPHPELCPITDPLTPSNALEILRGHDLVLDCTDRPFTRYLINDACVRLEIPLVSGAALGAAGQWAVYGGPEGKDSDVRRACYRCLWPKPGPSARCDEAGVWGPVTGLVGSGMAAEALRVVIGSEGKSSLHILHMGGSPMVRTVGMRPRSVKCVACGPNATITDDLESVDYDLLCNGGGVLSPEATEERLSVTVRRQCSSLITATTRHDQRHAPRRHHRGHS